MLQSRGFFPDYFRAAEELPVEADALEPVVESEFVGESYASVYFGRRFCDGFSDLGEMRFGVTGGQRRFFGQGIEGVGRVPHHGPAGFEISCHFCAHVFYGLKRADDAPELFTDF